MVVRTPQEWQNIYNRYAYILEEGEDKPEQYRMVLQDLDPDPEQDKKVWPDLPGDLAENIEHLWVTVRRQQNTLRQQAIREAHRIMDEHLLSFDERADQINRVLNYKDYLFYTKGDKDEAVDRNHRPYTEVVANLGENEKWDEQKTRLFLSHAEAVLKSDNLADIQGLSPDEGLRRTNERHRVLRKLRDQCGVLEKVDFGYAERITRLQSQIKTELNAVGLQLDDRVNSVSIQDYLIWVGMHEDAIRQGDDIEANMQALRQRQHDYAEYCLRVARQKFTDATGQPPETWDGTFDKDKSLEEIEDALRIGDLNLHPDKKNRAGYEHIKLEGNRSRPPVANWLQDDTIRAQYAPTDERITEALAKVIHLRETWNLRGDGDVRKSLNAAYEVYESYSAENIRLFITAEETRQSGALEKAFTELIGRNAVDADISNLLPSTIKAVNDSNELTPLEQFHQDLKDSVLDKNRARILTEGAKQLLDQLDKQLPVLQVYATQLQRDRRHILEVITRVQQAFDDNKPLVEIGHLMAPLDNQPIIDTLTRTQQDQIRNLKQRYSDQLSEKELLVDLLEVFQYALNIPDNTNAWQNVLDTCGDRYKAMTPGPGREIYLYAMASYLYAESLTWSYMDSKRLGNVQQALEQLKLLDGFARLEHVKAENIAALRKTLGEDQQKVAQESAQNQDETNLRQEARGCYAGKPFDDGNYASAIKYVDENYAKKGLDDRTSSRIKHDIFYDWKAAVEREMEAILDKPDLDINQHLSRIEAINRSKVALADTAVRVKEDTAERFGVWYQSRNLQYYEEKHRKTAERVRREKPWFGLALTEAEYSEWAANLLAQHTDFNRSPLLREVNTLAGIARYAFDSPVEIQQQHLENLKADENCAYYLALDGLIEIAWREADQPENINDENLEELKKLNKQLAGIGSRLTNALVDLWNLAIRVLEARKSNNIAQLLRSLDELNTLLKREEFIPSPTFLHEYRHDFMQELVIEAHLFKTQSKIKTELVKVTDPGADFTLQIEYAALALTKPELDAQVEGKEAIGKLTKNLP